MIYLRPREYSMVFEKGAYIIKGKKIKSCPKCNGQLDVHGTCSRRMYTLNGRAMLQLRVMRCGSCGRTHRELPPFLVPYKRYSLRAICEILCSEPGKETCPASTKLNLMRWLAAILACAQKHMDELRNKDMRSVITEGIDQLFGLLSRIIREMLRKEHGTALLFKHNTPSVW